MKSIYATVLLMVLGTLFSLIAFGQVSANPYIRRDGILAGGHMRSNPDGNPYNNWTSKPNINPYTGERGTHDPDRLPSLDRFNTYDRGYDSSGLRRRY